MDFGFIPAAKRKRNLFHFEVYSIVSVSNTKLLLQTWTHLFNNYVTLIIPDQIEPRTPS